MRARRCCGLMACLLTGWGGDSRAAAPVPAPPDGAELFARVWEPKDPRAHGGDGLGPVFNERSCLACHKQGGPGGAGPGANDVTILTATSWSRADDPKNESLASVHQDFLAMPSAVYHRHGIDPRHDGLWQSLTAGIPRRQGLTVLPANDVVRRLGIEGAGLPDASGFVLTRRNTPPLFGAGLIDAVPDEAIEFEAGRGHPGFPEVKGRAAKQWDGRVGRFGWKGQITSLDDFVRTACAGELGLEVPGHHQSAAPAGPAVTPPGLDMTQAECAALVAYVGGLPAPVVREPRSPADLTASIGAEIFAGIGCATCHAPSLGEARGIFSDLLLHDLGSALTDSGAYYGQPDAEFAAKPQEWRTPPLWGLRDSSPYLHDGRARTIQEAILAHGGEAARAARRYQSLDRVSQQVFLTFLDSLAAPPRTAHLDGKARPRRAVR